MIHWTICSASSAQDTLPTVHSPLAAGELSARSLSLETLAKLTVNEANVDLLIATLAEGAWESVRSFLEQDSRAEDSQVRRELAAMLVDVGS